MVGKYISILILCFTFVNAISDNNITKTIKPLKQAYVNINSNVIGTKVYIDGDFVGETPIKRYQVTPNKNYYLFALANKKLYKADIHRTINIKTTTIPSINLEFEKAQGKVFLVGGDGELYINGKFNKVLHARNRVFEVDAAKNIKFKIKDGYKEGVVYQDVYANSFNEIDYKMILIPLDIRLYTQTINNEMWEDTKKATNTPRKWEKAKKYCTNLRIGGFKDWHLPTIAELENLYKKHKSEIYNGFGGKFYWSNETKSGENNIWQYAKVLNKDGEVRKSVEAFENGRVRCVRIINKDLPIPTLKIDINKTIKPIDTNITQNLDRFLLK